jgi:hypothetical protein
MLLQLGNSIHLGDLILQDGTIKGPELYIKLVQTNPIVTNVAKGPIGRAPSKSG